MALTEGENTFTTVAEADTFWSDRNDSDWSNASPSEKEAALRDATVFIDNEYDWPGTIADDSQKLSWPRDNAYDTEGRLLKDIPQAIKDVAAYLAGQKVKGVDIFEIRQRGDRIKSMTAGSVEIEYEDHAKEDTVFEYVKSRLAKITYTGNSQVRLVRS